MLFKVEKHIRDQADYNQYTPMPLPKQPEGTQTLKHPFTTHQIVVTYR